MKDIDVKYTILLTLLFLLISCGTSPIDPGTQNTSFLTSPANGESLTVSEVSFEWDAVSGATRYYHQIDSDQSMQSPEETSSSSPGVNVTPESKGTWWWRVRAAVEGQSYYTEWSEVWSFTLI